MSAESKLWVQPEAGAFRLYASLGAAREHVATFKREVDANQACERINGWQQLQINNQAWQTELRIAKEQRDSLLAACKGLLAEIDSAIERHSMGHRVLTFDGRRKLNEAIKDCEASNE